MPAVTCGTGATAVASDPYSDEDRARILTGLPVHRLITVLPQIRYTYPQAN